MTAEQLLCIVGCGLSAMHVSLSFPVIVKVANAQLPSRFATNLQLCTGLLFYSSWVVYGILEHNYLFAFAFALGVVKYIAVFIQLILNF